MMSEMSPEEEIKDHVLQGRWDEVVKMCKDNYALILTVKINYSNDTVLHAAVNYGKERIVAELVKIIADHEKDQQASYRSALGIQNARGDNPLHVAASRGFAYMCYCIVGEKKERADLLKVDNKEGERPLFLAALNGHKDTFSFLVSWVGYSVFDLYRYDGDTILHGAIRREYFDLAVIMAHWHSDLAGFINDKRETPLKVLATRPSAFRSRSNLRWWDKLLYKCTRVEQVDLESESPPKPTMKADISDPTHRVYPENYETCCHFIWPKIAAFFDKKQEGDTEKKENYKTCCNFFSTLPKVAASLIGYFRKKGASAGDTENPKSEQKKEDKVDQKLGNLPPNYATISECLRSAYALAAWFAYVLAARLLGLDVLGIRRMKEKHVWSAQLLDLLMEEDPTDAYFGRGMRRFQSEEEIYAARERHNTNEQEKADVTDEIDTESTLLVAARNGIHEMVDKILQKIPISIEETTFKYERNIFLAAVESRQPNVIGVLKKHERWDTLRKGAGNDGNTALHLAAQQSKHSRDWQIPGSAVQMLWDIKWYEHVQRLVPGHFHVEKNQAGETPPKVFNENHKELLKEGGDWLRETSQSCSVVAALIAGVAYATAGAVPGGNNEETGKPKFEGQPAFNVFAIASLVALGFSVTALIMFLAILTSRKTAGDFRRDLPIKLLFGLSLLFVSIVSMLVSFGAAQFSLLEDKFKGILFPIYAATCLPASLYAIAQFPLYVDILRAIFTKVPQSREEGSDW